MQNIRFQALQKTKINITTYIGNNSYINKFERDKNEASVYFARAKITFLQ